MSFDWRNWRAFIPLGVPWELDRSAFPDLSALLPHLSALAAQTGAVYHLRLARGYWTITGNDEGYPVWTCPRESHREFSCEEIGESLRWGCFGVYVEGCQAELSAEVQP